MAKRRRPQQALELPAEGRAPTGKVECLGLPFDNDEARREHFVERLRENFKDPMFRKREDFPQGADKDILRMSDPPYYTTCPNPFLEDFIRCYGRPYDSGEPYQREPFAVDTSVGKTDALYKAHGYHTKVPHLAIVPSILHYTKPGDIVLDGFAGSGMTGVAAQWCGLASPEYRKEVELEWKKDDRAKPEWGVRRAILNDLGPAATFISAGYNLPFDVVKFASEAERILDEVERELGWMYETRHKKGRVGRINYTVWSEVFSCPECSAEVVFLEEALDRKTSLVRNAFACPKCRASLTKDTVERLFETRVDPATKQPWSRIRLVPVIIRYNVDGKEYEKDPDEEDRARLAKIDTLPLPAEVPTVAFPLEQMYHGSRLGPKGFTHVHHMFLPRPAQSLAALWRKAAAAADSDTRRLLIYMVEQAFWTMSVANSYRPTGFSQVSQYFKGVYYIPSQHAEVSPWYVLSGKARRLAKVFERKFQRAGAVAIATGDCAAISIPDRSIDYIFTDPPFGANIPYADLNFIVEAWHRVTTAPTVEAIVDSPKGKALNEYQELMRRCFSEYARVLKPGRWMTVVFSNSSNAVWRAIQEAMGTAGFVVADVRTLDKQQGSYRQVTSSAVKQDLVISAYKPTESLATKFALGEATEAGAWAFVSEHLRNVPVFVPSADKGEVVAERTLQMLHDRMIAFHVQRGLAVPISGPEFEAGLRQRFPERDGMFFVPHQVAEYDRKRTTVSELKQLELFVTDESSAIRWLRQQLEAKPRTLQDLTPEFTRQLQAWERHEVTIELRDLLAQNFVSYDGEGPVPSQIHKYLSTNYKELRNLAKADAALVRRARGRWYVPDPAKAVDLEKLRLAALLKEFNEYVEDPSRRLKVFRTEAVRAGFKAAYDARDYDLIVRVADKLPETVLQEDEQLLMYYDVASTRLGH
jgi:DNA modification methylase